MEEEDHIHSNSTPSSHTLLHMAAGLLPMAAAPLSLFFSSLHSHTLSLCSQKHASFIGKHGEPLQHICQHGRANKALNHATKCGINVASTCLVGYCHKWQYPNKQYMRKISLLDDVNRHLVFMRINYESPNFDFIKF